jgi:hypothetical protein
MEGWVPEPTKRVYWVRRGSLVDREEATAFRDKYFPPRPLSQPTAAVIDFSGMPTANPGRLRELVLPVAQGIRGGVYGPMVLFVSTADAGLADFVNDLAIANDVGLFWSQTSDNLEDARPLGDLTTTERATLELLKELGGQATAAQFAERAGIEATAAGNRLVNLVRKGYLYRFERTRRDGDLFVDPRGVDAEP